MRARANKRSARFVVLDCAESPPEVIGDGKTIEEALANTREWHYADKCGYCARCADRIEDTWRVYAIDLRAYELLTCGGPYDDAFRGSYALEFAWSAERACFVLVEASCVACRGKGETKTVDERGGKRRVSCNVCGGCRTLSARDLEVIEWIDPSEDEALWRGDGGKRS